MTLLHVLTYVFVAASVTLYAMQYFDHPAIPGYLLAGLIISPFIDATQVLDLAQVGILFLAFIFGLKFDPDEVASVAQATVVATVLQLIITGSIGYAVAAQLGLASFEAIALAVVCALSSTLIGLDLAEQEIHRRLLHGRLAESMHLVQDLIGLLVLALVFASSPSAAVIAAVLSLALILVALSMRRYVFTVIGESIAYNAEVLMLIGFSSLILSVYLAHLFGLPLVIGAFAAGIAGAKFPYNMELLDTLGSVKDFFAAIFFVTLGALVGIPSALTFIIAGAVFVVTVAVKPYIAAEIFKHTGYTERTSVLAGLSLNHVSELSFILIIQGFLDGLVSIAVFEGVIVGGVVSMVVSSYAKRNEERLYRLVSNDWRVKTSFNDEDHVVVIGADTPGRRVAETITDRRVIVVDNDEEKLAWVEDASEHVVGVHGDVMNGDVLDAVNADKASLVVSTALQSRVSAEVLNVEAQRIIVYAPNVREAEAFYDAGASYVVVPDLAVAAELDEHLDEVDSEAGRAMLREAGKALLRELYADDENVTLP